MKFWLGPFLRGRGRARKGPWGCCIARLSSPHAAAEATDCGVLSRLPCQGSFGGAIVANQSMALFLQACGAAGPLRLGVEYTAGREALSREFEQPFLLVGREAAADLPLNDPAVSRRHAYLQVIAGHLFCLDVVKGEVLWEKRIFGPLAVQRLANGNTFVGTDSVLDEFDAKGKEVSALTIPGERIMKAARLPNGESVCLTTEERVVRLDAAGKEVSSFPVKISTKLFGGKLHVLSNGHVLVPLNAEDRVVEYNGTGEKVWEAKVEQPITATRLANGNTLVTSMLPAKGAMEFDRYGNMVWQFKANTRVTRAFRR